MLQKPQLFSHQSDAQQQECFHNKTGGLPGRGEQLKAREQNGKVWGVISADMNELTKIWVDKGQLIGERV